MKTSIKTVLAALSAVTLLAGAGMASADTRFDQTHPRREEVNQRLANQSHRIREARRAGAISRAEARRLHRRDHLIRVQERVEARHHHGHLTRAEQRRLNREENRVSGEIRR